MGESTRLRHDGRHECLFLYTIIKQAGEEPPTWMIHCGYGTSCVKELRREVVERLRG